MTAQAMSKPDLSDLDALLQDIERFDEIFAGWDDNQQGAVNAYRSSIDALHSEALRRLIRALSESPEALAVLKSSLSDELVYAVFRHLGVVKPSLQERIEGALETVRPMLASHGGGVDLIAVTPPDTVEVRFLGACDGCPASMLTFVAGVKKAIEDACPEITNIVQAKGLGGGASGRDDKSVQFVSPFALGHDADWQFAARLDEVPDGNVLKLHLSGEDVLLSRNGDVVSCFQNACAHLGMPLDDGPVDAGIVTCPHHGFRYDLRSGECLTAPEVQLQAHAVRVIGGKVEVRLAK